MIDGTNLFTFPGVKNQQSKSIMQKGGKEFTVLPWNPQTDLTTGKQIRGYNYVKRDINGLIISTKERIETQDGYKLEYRDNKGNIQHTSSFKYHSNPSIIDRTDTDSQGKIIKTLYRNENGETTYKDSKGNEITEDQYNNL